MKFTRNEWLYMGQWQQPTLSNCFWCYWHLTDTVKTLIPEYRFHSLINPDCQFWFNKEDQNNTISFLEKLLASSEQTETFRNKLQSVGEEVVKKHLNVLATPQDDYRNVIPALFNTFREVTGVWTLGWLVGDELGKFLVAKGFYTENELLDLVTHNTQTTWLEKQYQEIKSLGDCVNKLLSANELITEAWLNNQPELFSEIKKHVAEYEWYGTHHWIGEPYTLAKCLDLISDYRAKAKNAEEEALVVTNPKAVALTKLLFDFNYWRTHSAEVAAKVVYESRPALIACAQDLGLSYDDFVYLSDAEIVDYIQTQKKPADLTAVIAERKKSHGCCVEGTTLKVIVGNELKGIVAGLHEKADNLSRVLKGLVACKGGVVRGKARIVIAQSDLRGFVKGEILVTSQTTPDFVPYMQSSIAVVTDQGGVTSHAAIVSREMNIPCVIGTKYATQVFKTGDMIEVDSEKGTVTIVS